MIARIVILLWAGLAASCASTPDFSGLQGFSDTRYEEVLSSETGHRYHVFVRLPEQYAHHRKRHYPVVYLLDAGAMFPKLAGYYHYLRLGNEVPELILVGISYGTDRFAEGNFRASDFTAPAADRDYWGDAPRFQAFLAKELMPAMERQYRIDPTRRILFGQSLGGQFVIYSALSDPDLFWGHIASNPALHRNVGFFIDYPQAEAVTLSSMFVAYGELDAARFREPLQRWLYSLDRHDSLPWRLSSQELAGQSHFSAAPEAFRHGLRWLFGITDAGAQ